MPTLEDDIARIARLRGGDPETALASAADLQEERGRAWRAQASGVFQLDGQFAEDLKVFDRLPRASRLFIFNSPVPICARKYADLLLAADGAEGEVILAVERETKGRLDYLNAKGTA